MKNSTSSQASRQQLQNLRHCIKGVRENYELHATITTNLIIIRIELNIFYFMLITKSRLIDNEYLRFTILCSFSVSRYRSLPFSRCYENPHNYVILPGGSFPGCHEEWKCATGLNYIITTARAALLQFSAADAVLQAVTSSGSS